MPIGAFVTPIAGGNIFNVWEPVPGKLPGPSSDAFMPFVIGARAIIVPVALGRDEAQFARVAGLTVLPGGDVAIINGVTSVALPGNTWRNETGQTLDIGDYAWFTSGETTSP